MGIAAGGKMKQRIYPDPHGIDTWDLAQSASITIYIVSAEHYRALTGLTPPPTPISPQTYTQYGLPWFDLYDEVLGTLAAADPLAQVPSVHQQDLAHGQTSSDAVSVEIPEAQIKSLTPQQKRQGS